MATYLGKERAADIAVNIMLPFIYALKNPAYRFGTARKTLDLFRAYPRLATNSTEKRMVERLGLDKTTINSARQQQGLIHIYKNFCSLNKCKKCPLSKLQTRNYIKT